MDNLDLPVRTWLLLQSQSMFSAIRRAPVFFLLGLLSAWLLSGLYFFDFSPKGFNTKRVTLVLAGFALCLLPALSGQFRQALLARAQQLHPLIRLMVFMVFMLGVASGLLAQFPEKGLQEAGLYGLLLFMLLSVSLGNIDERCILLWLWFCVVALLVYCLGYAFRYGLYLQYPPESWSFSIYQYSNPRSLNHVQGWLIPLAVILPLAYRQSAGLLCRLSWFPLVALFFFMLVSGGRGLPLALLGSWLVTFLLFRRQAREQLRLQLQAFLPAVLLYVVLIQWIPLGFERENFLYRMLYYPDSGRLHLWNSAWQAFTTHPWLGVGPQHFITLESGILASPHSLLLQWLSEWGLPATLLMTGLLMWAFLAYTLGVRKKLLGRQLSPMAAHIQVALFSALLTSALYAQISGVLITPLSQLVMVLLVGSCFSLHFRGRDNDYAMHRLERYAWWCLFVGLMAVFFLIFFREWCLDQYPISIPLEPNWPRFWRNGDFINNF